MAAWRFRAQTQCGHGDGGVPGVLSLAYLGVVAVRFRHFDEWLEVLNLDGCMRCGDGVRDLVRGIGSSEDRGGCVEMHVGGGGV